MYGKRRQPGLTLIEILVVVSIIAILVGFGAPAVRGLLQSFQSENITQAVVQGVLDTARNLAMSTPGCDYIGVRFQKAFDPDAPDDQQYTDQYMVLVGHAPRPTGLGYAMEFHALEGYTPIRLPSPFYVTDLMVTNASTGVDGDFIDSDADVAENDMTTFTILFSSTGQVLTRNLRIRNVDGRAAALNNTSEDRIFNTAVRIGDMDPLTPMFRLDDDSQDHYEENSRGRIYILERDRLARAQSLGQPWGAYLREVAMHPIYVSPYNGQLVESTP